MKTKTLILLILVAIGTQGSSCGGSEDGGSVTVITNQEQQVALPQSEATPETDCERACTLECAGSSGLSFEVKLQCFTEEETLQSGTAETISDLPVDCLNRPLPNCDGEI